jgi:hypothetical protein
MLQLGPAEHSHNHPTSQVTLRPDSDRCCYLRKTKRPASDFAPTGLVCYTTLAFGALPPTPCPEPLKRLQGFSYVSLYIRPTRSQASFFVHWTLLSHPSTEAICPYSAPTWCLDTRYVPAHEECVPTGRRRDRHPLPFAPQTALWAYMNRNIPVRIQRTGR